jgi:uncharacterized protein
MYSSAYLDYLIEFHATRDYFECHEILEEHWKHDPPGKRKLYWVGLIQLAVALYHQRRQNIIGAKRMFRSSLRIIELEQKEFELLGIDVVLLKKMIRDRLNQTDAVFIDFMIPIIDDQLLGECQKLSSERQLIWGKKSALELDQLIHKHTLRDRTNVIEERQRKLLKNQKK